MKKISFIRKAVMGLAAGLLFFQLSAAAYASQPAVEVEVEAKSDSALFVEFQKLIKVILQSQAPADEAADASETDVKEALDAFVQVLLMVATGHAPGENAVAFEQEPAPSSQPAASPEPSAQPSASPEPSGSAMPGLNQPAAPKASPSPEASFSGNIEVEIEIEDGILKAKVEQEHKVKKEKKEKKDKHYGHGSHGGEGYDGHGKNKNKKADDRDDDNDHDDDDEDEGNDD